MTEPLRTFAEACRHGRHTLAGSSPSPTTDAEHLLAYATGYDRVSFRAYPEREIDPSAWQQYRHLLKRRQQGEPVAYLLGWRGFMDFELAVDPRVLIPRPETEHLVEAALALSAQRILELGTGSGCVAIALAKAKPQAMIDAVDCSADALAVASANADRLAARNIRFIEGDWYGPVSTQRYDLIVSNPPYIGDDEPEPDQGDARFEPRLALRAGPDGLDAIRLIVENAPQHLNKNGWLWLEHGWQQGDAVRQALTRHGFSAIETRPDLAGHERVTGGCLQESINE